MKLLHVWQALTAQQRKDIAQNLVTHVPKIRTDTARLLAYLLENPTIKVDNFDKNAAFRYLYNEKPYNDVWLRMAQSQLLKGIEQFVALRTMQSDKITVAYHIAEFYAQDSEQLPYFAQALQELSAKTDDIAQRDENHYTILLRTENLRLRNSVKKREIAAENLQNILDLQEKHFAAGQLRTVCMALSHQVFHQNSFDFGLFEVLVQRIEKANWQETEPLIGAYYFLYKMATLPDEETYFSVFRKNMPQYIAIFTRKEQYECYVFALNYVIKRVNKGEQAYFRTLFELYKEGIENGILLMENGEINPMTFRNIVNTGLRIGEAAYIAVFLEKYKPLLPRAVRRNYYEHALARYYFATSDFENATKLFLHLNYGELPLQLDAKMVLIKIYYETDNYDALDKHLSSFQQFLHRKRASLSYHQANYKNIIAFAKRLIHLNQNDKKSVECLRNDIQRTSPLTEKEWLLAKITLWI